MKKVPDQIFELSPSGHATQFLPNQVFKNRDFTFSLSTRNDLFEFADEYDLFVKFLKEIGESHFYILEHAGTYKDPEEDLLQATIPVTSDFLAFRNIVASLDLFDGLMGSNLMIFGDSDSWGIHLSEWLALILIGSEPALAQGLREVFGIEGNGYEQTRQYLDLEFQHTNDGESAKVTFLKNYRLLESNDPAKENNT
jgi:hypothetical protein